MRLDRTQWKIQALTALFVLSTWACSVNRPAEQWENDVLEAQTQLDRGTLKDLKPLEDAIQRAPDEPRKRWAIRQLAERLLEEKDNEAAENYLMVLTEPPIIDPPGAWAMYQRALLQKSKGNDRESLSRLFATILKYPNEIPAEWALEDLKKRYFASESYEGWDAILKRMYPWIQESMLAENLLFERGRNYDVNLRDPDRAMEVYAQIWADHPEEALADDAIWEIAQIQARVQNWNAAIHNFMILTESGESSWFVGTYNSQWLDDAILEVAHAWVHLGEHEKASQWFLRFVDEYSDSLRAPYALWLGAECYRLMGADERHLSLMKRLTREYPDSKWARRASARLGLGGGDD